MQVGRNHDKWICLAFCSKCWPPKLLGSIGDVTKKQKDDVEDIARLKCFCKIEKHNSHSDLNLNLKFVWRQDWGEEE